MTKEELVQLVRSCQKDDLEAMNKLLAEIQPSVYYQCRKILGRDEDAEDATQEILLRVYGSLKQLQEPEAFWGWVNRMTANHCKNMIMRSHPEQQFLEDEEGNSTLDNLEDLDEQAVPDHVIDNQETRRMVSELVDSLPPSQRICVMMHYYDELPLKEIAETLEVPENTVKSRLNYARKSIKEGVLDYEKQGVKLYGLSPLPFLLYFLRRDSESGGLSSETAQQMISNVIASVGSSAAGTASGAAVGEGAVNAARMAFAASGSSGGAGIAGNVAATAGGGAAGAAAASAAGKAATGIFTKAVSMKVAAVVTAGALVAGSAGGSVLTHRMVSDQAEAEVAAVTEQYEAEMAAATERIDAEIQEGIEAGKPHSTEDFAAVLDEYMARETADANNAWVDSVLAKAESLAAEGNYSWAIRLVDNSLNYFPNESRLLDAKERYSTVAPVWLFGMEYYYSYMGFQPVATTITNGDNIYSADRAITLSNHAGAYIQYALNGKFSRLTGILIPYEYFQLTGGPTEDFRMVILADGEIVQDYRFSRENVGQSSQMELDVTGVQLLQIQFYDLNNIGTVLGDGGSAKIGLADFYLYP